MQLMKQALYLQATTAGFDLDLFELDLFLKWNYCTQIYLKLIKYNLDSGRDTGPWYSTGNC